MDGLRMLIATSDPYHLLMVGYALGGSFMFAAFQLLKARRGGHER